ncbi:MAG: ribosome biogenesis GTPase [Chlamydiales bacterium]
MLNALRPGSASTGDVRSGDGKGRHTTTGSTLYELERGTRVIDTPGIRSFGLWQTGKHELAAEFSEFARHADGCRFRDCLHVVDPGCAVRAATEDGEIEALRYEAYRRIQDSLD